jgi:hypothetical protein
VALAKYGEWFVGTASKIDGCWMQYSDGRVCENSDEREGRKMKFRTRMLPTLVSMWLAAHYRGTSHLDDFTTTLHNTTH